MSRDIDTVTLSIPERSVTLGRGATDSAEAGGALTPGLIRNINTDLAEAKRQVESREMERVVVTVAITVGRNKDDEVVAVYARRGTTLEKGRLQVAPTGQGRLMEE